jgi:hypothetical protein
MNTNELAELQLKLSKFELDIKTKKANNVKAVMKYNKKKWEEGDQAFIEYHLKMANDYYYRNKAMINKKNAERARRIRKEKKEALEKEALEKAKEIIIVFD